METTLDANNWLLTVLVFAPLAGALVMMFFPQDEEDTHKQLALLTSLVPLGLTVFLLLDFDYDQAGVLQYFTDNEWMPGISGW